MRSPRAPHRAVVVVGGCTCHRNTVLKFNSTHHKCSFAELSISWGNLPQAATGEFGFGDGLRVSLLTRLGEVRVTYEQRELLSAALPDIVVLRANTSIPVTLSHRARGLSLSVGNATLLHERSVPEWAPQPDWHFALGARNRLYSDNHFIQDLELEVGSLIDEVAVGLQWSSNAQQYSDASAQFVYFGAPTLSAVSPALGPGTARLVAFPCM